MAAKKETEKEYAKLLFIKHGMNQKDIALKVKVTDKTIGKWASDGKWLAQKESLFATRSNIIEKLTNQIRLLNDKFENREDKLATLQEGRLLVDYARSIKSLENEIGVGETITTLRDFVSFLQTVNFELSLKVNDYADMFINHKIK